MGSCTAGEELGQQPVSIPRADPQTNYSTRDHTTYDRLRDMHWGLCEEALAVVRDAHWIALVAVALLEDKIEMLSHSLSHSC